MKNHARNPKLYCIKNICVARDNKTNVVSVLILNMLIADMGTNATFYAGSILIIT